jgi:hypothetical protein
VHEESFDLGPDTGFLSPKTGFAPFAEERILSIDESIIEGDTRLKKILSKMR